jgi:hypothetical protein
MLFMRILRLNCIVCFISVCLWNSVRSHLWYSKQFPILTLNKKWSSSITLFSYIFFFWHKLICRSRDNSVDKGTGYWLDDRGIGVRVSVRVIFLCSPHCPDWFCEPLSLLSNGYKGAWSKATGAWSWPFIRQLVLKSRKHRSMHPLPSTSSWCSA